MSFLKTLKTALDRFIKDPTQVEFQEAMAAAVRRLQSIEELKRLQAAARVTPPNISADWYEKLVAEQIRLQKLEIHRQRCHQAAVFLSKYSGIDAEGITKDPELRKRAYRLAARKLHPDRTNGQTKEAFQQLTAFNKIFEESPE